MRNHKISLFMLVFILNVALFLFCNKETIKETELVETNGADGRVIGTINGVITDAIDNARLDSVKISWAIHDSIKTTYSSDLGYYTITYLYPGDYEISFSEKDPYAVYKSNIHIPDINEVGINQVVHEEDFYYQKILNIDLYKKDATLKGKIYKVINDELIELASGVTVIADFQDYDLSPDEYTTTTNSSGEYEFTLLPNASPINIRTMPYDDGTYKFAVYSRNNVSIIPNGIKNEDDIILNIEQPEPFIIENNFEHDDVALADNLVITFSKQLVTSTFDIELTSTAFDVVEFSSSWSNDVALTIDPYVSLQANTTYRLYLSGKSYDDYALDTTLYFETIDGIRFVKTNLERFDGVYDEFPIDSNITIDFDMAVNIDYYKNYVELKDEDSALVATELSLANSSKQLVINPVFSLEPGMDYVLSYKLYSTIDEDYDDRRIEFMTAFSDENVPGQPGGFALNMGSNWKADWNTASISFKWNSVEKAEKYFIYAYDNDKNTDLVKVAEIDHLDYESKQYGGVDLTQYPQFDLYEDDAYQTPFACGTQVYFQVAAVNDFGESAHSSKITVRDQEITAFTYTQNKSANNTAGDGDITVKIEITMANNEYFRETVPSIVIRNAGDFGYGVSDNDITVDWSTDMATMIFYIDVPKGKDASGDILTVNQYYDCSNNMQIDQYQIILN